MGRKAKRLKLKARIERLSAQASRPSPVIENSVMQERVKALGKQVRSVINIVWTDLPDETAALEEEREPWYKTKTKDEIAKGMRGTLTGASAGNKFMPATGMKDASTNKKSKSAPVGAGALEEECVPIEPSIRLKIR